MKHPELLCQAQQDAITHIYEYNSTYLIGQMGSGKSVVALTGAAELLKAGEVQRVLVVAPKRVANDVWRHEHTTWTHLEWLMVTIATGTPAARIDAIDSGAKIVVINFENLEWFFDVFGVDHGFDMLIVDEVTKLKGGGTTFKALRRRLNDFKVKVVQTGTPVAESWVDLFYCMLACDGGLHFGRNKQTFLKNYFYPLDYEARNWAIRSDCVEPVTRMISNTVVVLPDYTDELPPLKEVHSRVFVPRAAMDYYQQFERDSINEDATADSAAVQTGKLQQLASGFLYTDKHTTKLIHNVKVPWATDLGDGVQTIYVYQFTEELIRLEHALPNGRRLGVSDVQDTATLLQWRSGELQALFLHPKSAGHGLDLSAGYNMVIMSPIWSRDLMRQVIARIWRRNQTETCTVWVLVAAGTIDEDIVAREHGKGSHHELLMARLNK